MTKPANRRRVNGKPAPSLELETLVKERAGDPELVVAGVDEVGVGSLAGPVLAAAVVLPDDLSGLLQLRESKQCSRRERERFASLILERAVAVGVGYATHREIDAVGIARARARAVVRAFQDCRNKLRGRRVVAVVDGRVLAKLRGNLGGAPTIFADHADERSLSVAAASVVAKVARDRYMRKVSLMFPDYDLASSKGYGTPQHLAALKKLGPSAIHRLSFGPCARARRVE